MDVKSVMSGLEGLTEYDWRMYHSDSEVRNIARDALSMLKEQPEIIRCKDCKYGQKCTDGETTYQCFKWNCGEFWELHEQNWFCADGQR